MGLYFLMLIDDFSRATWVYLLVNKSSVCTYFEHFFTIIQTQYHKTIKIFELKMG